MQGRKRPMPVGIEDFVLAELSRQGVKDIWKYGISFHGKKVWLEQGEPPKTVTFVS